ncbi:MAG: PTS system mannose/fructose/sorbose family transporter subunit IID [bacterium]
MDARLKKKIFLRSMLLQACWNFERMQNVGFAFAILPALRKIWPAPDKLKKAFARHIASLNTQPYMAGFVLGMTAKMEEDLASSEEAVEGAAGRIQNFKRTVASALAAIGDSLFWGIMRPLTLEISVLVWWFSGFYRWTMLSGGKMIGVCCDTARLPEVIHGTVMANGGQANPGALPGQWAILAGPVAGLIAYNALSLWVRWKGLSAGYACGGRSPDCGLAAVDWQKLIKASGFLCFAAAVFLLASSYFVCVLPLFFEGISAASCRRLAMPPLVVLLAWAVRRAGYTNAAAYTALIPLSAVFFWGAGKGF